MKKTSKNVEKLQNARSLSELLSVVDVIKASIAKIGKSTNGLLKGLSSTSTINISLSSAEEVELSDIKRRAKRTYKETELSDIKKSTTTHKKAPTSLKTVLDKSTIKTPSKTQLAKNSTALEEITSAIEDLQIALRVLTTKQFAKMDDSKAAVALIKGLIDQAKTLKDTHLNAISVIARDFTPTDHKKAVKALRKLIKSEINEETYTAIQVKSFILNPAPDTIYYQTFMLLRNLTNEDGFAYEAYSYVLTGSFDIGSGELTHFMTTLKDPKVPGTFPIGKEVPDVRALSTQIKAYNVIDNLISTQGRLKFNKSGRDVRTGPLGASKDIDTYNIGGKTVAGIRIQNKQLYIRLKRGLSDRQKKDLVLRLVPIIKAIFIPKARKTSLSWKEIKGKNSGANFLVFTLSRNEDTKSREFIHKVSRLARELGLSPKLARETIQAVVNQNDL